MLENLKQQFKDSFGKNAQNVFFCPGRVNLIGEHIDYNGGLVMPCAISMGTYLLVSENNEGKFRFKSINFEETLDIPIKESYEKTGKEWYNYPLGVIQHFLLNNKTLKGLDLLYFGNLPIGSSLSSSASIEIVTAFALNELFSANFSKLDLVKLSKKVENEFMGVNSGIMDQFAVAFGAENKAIKLDCNTLDYQLVECDLGDHYLAIINTNKPRKLTESKYNERVAECQEGLKTLQSELNIKNLCDITSGTFEPKKELIADPVILKRVTHVIAENDRVLDAAKALDDGRLDDFGKLMFASHDSLQHLYEVSGIELDTIVDFCKQFEGVTGARMTGAGFGGCAIALVKKDRFDAFQKELVPYYTARIGYEPSVYSSLPGTGVKSL